MRVKLLIATVDTIYAGLLSDNISERHADIIDVSVCCALECLQEMLLKQKYDVALIDTTLIGDVNTGSIRLPLLLWTEDEAAAGIPAELGKINKHQRISSIVAAVLERYAGVSGNRHDSAAKHAKITAVWSPSGGVGKTSVALAYALSKVSGDNVSNDGAYGKGLSGSKEVFYLNLENFSSISGFFGKNGKSVSSVFEMLDNKDGNVKMLVQGICSRDKGITYLCEPDNYDDMNILSNENIKELISSCAKLTDELVIDLSCVCDIRTENIFEAADNLLIVTGQSIFAEVKLAQFISQNDIFERIKEKAVFVANMGAVINDPPADTIISLPLIQSDDAVAVIYALSEHLSGEPSLHDNSIGMR